MRHLAASFALVEVFASPGTSRLTRRISSRPGPTLPSKRAGKGTSRRKAAAEEVDLVNATATGCIRNLEEYLGVTPVQRNTRLLNLTEECTPHFQRCLEVLRGVEQADVRIKLGRARNRRRASHGSGR